MRIAICDDDEVCRAQLVTLLKRYIENHEEQDISYSVFSCAKDLLAASKFEQSFDVYILDVMMPDTNGIDLGVMLRENKDNGIIVYLTSSREFAVDSYHVKASNYLLKPVLPQQLYATLEEIYTLVSNKTQDCILVKTKNSLVRISLDNILYVELCKRIIVYHLTNQETEESIFLRIPFTEAVQDILKDKRFVLCAKGLVINLSHVLRIKDTEVVFTGEQTVFFSKKTCQTIRAKWSAFYSQ